MTANLTAETLLKDVELCEALRRHRGYETTPNTLATKRCRGGGPPFVKFSGHRVVYRWGAALSWLDEQTEQQTSTSTTRRAARKPAIPATAPTDTAA